MFNILSKIFGTKNDRELKRLYSYVEDINKLEGYYSSLTDGELKSKTDEFKKRLEKGEILDDLLRDAFATVREVSKRVLSMRHFDVQLIGGIVLHEGKIAEMRTGEGKTLVATLAAYLNALEGKGVHIVTVNDYLAKRDTQWMGPIYHFLGLSVGVIQHDNSFLYDPQYMSSERRYQHLKPCTRQEAYRADITYGTNNEFGFDYLRDNMKYDLSDFCQRDLHYAIVDEVDSILIDEARTPLIISGPSEESTGKYYTINKIIPNLKRDIDFKIDEKLKSVILTEAGNEKVEKLLNVKNLYDPANVALIHHVIQALRAHYLFKKDVDYVVKDNEVVIVDEFTGRLMPGRRWSDGLHQAIEAKEGVRIESENQTLATITFQNYFRMYKKLAGMTGTADTEAAEFSQIYNLDVIVIPTNKPMIRNDFPDVIYKTERAKFDAVIKEIENCHKRGQPVLVGTISIEASEHLSKLLSKKGIKHSVLNAKYHEKEAEIIAQAGRLGAVTIATNMAGRGTDIIFGGNYEMLAKNLLKDRDNYSEAELKETLEKAKEICQREKEQVIALGGLHIIGTERHESRRIDNQLRGRAGRQGDPGSSRFYLSLEDNLLRIFGSDRINGLMNMLKIDEEMPIENKMVTKAIENAQKRVEAHNFDIRKHLLEYDDVMNKQRQEIYSFRKEAFISESLKDRILEFAETEIEELLSIYCPDNSDRSEWNLASLKDALYGLFGVKIDSDLAEYKNTDDIKEVIFSHIRGEYDRKEKEIGSENLRYIERIMFLQTIDNQWKDHLLSIDRLKEGIGLRGYAQKDPLIEYKKEAFELFSEMSQRIRAEIIQRLFKIQIKKEETDLKVKEEQKLIYNRRDGDDLREPVKKGKKPGRNEPCPCGSGRKYKKCCGAS